MADVYDAALEVFRRVLGKPELSREDDFFRVGGGSVAAARILHLLEDECGVPLSLDLLFSDRTIGEVIDGSIDGLD